MAGGSSCSSGFTSTVAIAGYLHVGEVEDLMGVQSRAPPWRYGERRRGVLDDCGPVDGVARAHRLQLEYLGLDESVAARAPPVDLPDVLRRRLALLLGELRQRGLLDVDGPVNDHVRDEVAELRRARRGCVHLRVGLLEGSDQIVHLRGVFERAVR